MLLFIYISSFTLFTQPFFFPSFLFCTGVQPITEKAMAPHSSTFAQKIPWIEQPGGLQSMGSLESDTTEQLHFHFSLSCIGEGNGNPPSVLAWRIPGTGSLVGCRLWVAQSRTRLKRLSSSSSIADQHNGVIVSGEQSRDSAIHIHVSILPKSLSHSAAAT